MTQTSRREFLSAASTAALAAAACDAHAAQWAENGAAASIAPRPLLKGAATLGRQTVGTSQFGFRLGRARPRTPRVEATIEAVGVPSGMSLRGRVPGCVRGAAVYETRDGRKLRGTLKGQLGHRVAPWGSGVVLEGWSLPRTRGSREPSARRRVQGLPWCVARLTGGSSTARRARTDLLHGLRLVEQ